MADTQTTKVQFHVTMTMDCPICEGTGSDHGTPCTDCAGTGTVAEPIELVTALASLGILTRLEQVERTAGRAMQYADGLANGGI
jgi:DnaJ-class molecular chaperone